MTTVKEIVSEIEKLLPEVTPGPWAYQRPDTYVKGYMGTANVRVVAQMDENRRRLTNWQADLGYIAAVQPDNMRVMLSALADAERRDTAAEAKLAEAVKVMKLAEQFIVNGVELGFIRMPSVGDPALDTLPAIRSFIASMKGGEG